MSVGVWQYLYLPLQVLSCLKFNPVALRKAKIVYNFGLSECNKVKYPNIKVQA